MQHVRKFRSYFKNYVTKHVGKTSYCGFGSVVGKLTCSAKKFYEHCSMKYSSCFKYCEAKRFVILC